MNIMEPWTNEVETLIVYFENESANYAEIICSVICWKTKKYSGIFLAFVVACYVSLLMNQRNPQQNPYASSENLVLIKSL